MDLGPICMPAKEHGTSSVVYAFALFVVCNSSVPCQTSLCDADGGDHVKIIQRGGMLDDFEMEVPGERTLSGLWPTSIGSECRGGGGGACLHEVRGGNAFQPGRLVAGRELVDLAINDDELRRHLVHGSSFPQGHAWPRAPGSMDRWVTPRVQRAEAQLLEELIAWVSSDECYGLFSIDRTQRVQVHFDMRADPRQGDTRTRIRGQAREYLQAALDQLQDKDMLLVVLGRRPFREAYITKVLSQSDHRPQYATAVLDVLKFENGPSDDDADTFAVSFSPSHSLGAASPKFVCDFSSPRPLSTPNSTHRNSLHAQTDGSRVSRPDPGPSIVPGSRSSPRVRQTVAQPGSPVALPDALPRGLCVSNVPPVGHNMVDEPWSFVPFSDPLPQESGATLSSPPTGARPPKGSCSIIVGGIGDRTARAIRRSVEKSRSRIQAHISSSSSNCNSVSRAASERTGGNQPDAARDEDGRGAPASERSDECLVAARASNRQCLLPNGAESSIADAVVVDGRGCDRHLSETDPEATSQTRSCHRRLFLPSPRPCHQHGHRGHSFCGAPVNTTFSNSCRTTGEPPSDPRGERKTDQKTVCRGRAGGVAVPATPGPRTT